MAWASVTGAIDYKTDDGSTMFRLRERILLNTVDAQRRFDWYCARAGRHAALARGMSWLNPSSAVKVSGIQVEGMEESEEAALAAAFPYQEIARTTPLSKDVETAMQDAYVREFGGLPGSPEAETSIEARKEELLPSLKRKGMSQESPDAAAAASAADWARYMQPRRRHG